MLSKSQINFFLRYSKVPVPVNDPELFQYYVDLLDKHYNINEELKIFKESIKDHCESEESFNEYKNNIRTKNDEIIAMFTPLVI
jgi:hypothetical protein